MNRSISERRLARSISAVALALLVGGRATAQPDRAIAQLERSLPQGWALLATGSELVIRHDRPCYITGAQLENAPPNAARETTNGPLVTLELRYKLEPKWSARQLAAARTTNDSIGAELRAARAKYRIDQIHHSKGQPLPATADERARLDAYTAAEAAARARIVKLPRCSLGESSLFDDDAYQQLSLVVDPPAAMTEAHHVVELVKQACGAS